MNTSEFDHNIRSKFQELEVPHSEQLWQELRADLSATVFSKTKKKPIKKIGLVAAALVAFTLLWSGVMYQWVNKQSKELVEQHTAIQTPKLQPRQASLPSVPANQPISALTTNFPVANAYSRYLNKPFNAPGPKAVITVIESQVSTPIEKGIIEENIPTQTNQVSAGIPQTQQLNAEIGSLKKEGLALGPAINAYEPLQTNRTGKVQLGVFGSLGYGGNTSNGYAVGVNTKTPMGRKLFFENVVAFGSTQEIYNVQSFQTPAGAALVASKGINTNSNDYNLKGNLYYVSVAPTLGMKVTRKISVGAGGDVQRIVSNKINTPDNFFSTYTSSNNGSSVVLSQPVKWNNWDAGVSANASVKLSPRINVGVQYRQGLVNMLSAQEGMQLYRNYGSVMLQYSILGSGDDTANK